MQARRKAYLEAMGIPVWELREPTQAEAAAQAVQLGPGAGQVLLLGSTADESAAKLSSDVARCLKSEPVWGWPAGDESGARLEDSVGERLFTHILVFGPETETALFGGPAPDVVGSAVVIRAPSLEEIAQSGAGRRKLWAVLCQHRLAGIRDQAGAG